MAPATSGGVGSVDGWRSVSGRDSLNQPNGGERSTLVGVAVVAEVVAAAEEEEDEVVTRWDEPGRMAARCSEFTSTEDVVDEADNADDDDADDEDEAAAASLAAMTIICAAPFTVAFAKSAKVSCGPDDRTEIEHQWLRHRFSYYGFSMTNIRFSL